MKIAFHESLLAGSTEKTVGNAVTHIIITYTDKDYMVDVFLQATRALQAHLKTIKGDAPEVYFDCDINDGSSFSFSVARHAEPIRPRSMTYDHRRKNQT